LNSQISDIIVIWKIPRSVKTKSRKAKRYWNSCVSTFLCFRDNRNKAV